MLCYARLCNSPLYAFPDGVSLIDTRTSGWSVMYANDDFSKAAQEDVKTLVAAGFWDQFEPLTEVGCQQFCLLSPPFPKCLYLSVCMHVTV